MTISYKPQGYTHETRYLGVTADGRKRRGSIELDPNARLVLLRSRIIQVLQDNLTREIYGVLYHYREGFTDAEIDRALVDLRDEGKIICTNRVWWLRGDSANKAP